MKGPSSAPAGHAPLSRPPRFNSKAKAPRYGHIGAANFMDLATPLQGDKSLLILDDDVAFRTRLARALEGRGFEVTSAGSVAEASDVAAKTPPAYAVLD